MKHRHFAILAAAMALPAPAVAQQTAGFQFIQAVKDSDGNKATDLLATNPAGIVNARDGDNNTPLLIAIGRDDDQWTGFLLNKGADPNMAGKGGETPLIAATRNGSSDAVDWLLEMGAKVDGANRMGETPLIIAVQLRATPIVRRLLEAGADPDRADAAAGYSARDYATRDPRARDILSMIQAKKPKAK